MLTVHRVSALTGVSIRTLHHYDTIGLLKPAALAPNGYRLYDENALSRLQTILLFRELEFSLKDIRDILESEDFDLSTTLETQIKLLELKRSHLTKLISYARKIQKTGVMNMDFSAFDKKKIEEYTAEAKAKWGETSAYKEYDMKAANRTDDKNAQLANSLNDIFVSFGQIKTLAPQSEEALAKAAELKAFLTQNYYTVTNPIFIGLAQMYTGDERMKANIDKCGGEGTAEFVAAAIEAYCAINK